QKDFVEQPIALKNVDPGVDADQKRSPEGQHNRHDQCWLPTPWRTRDTVGDRIAEDEQKHRRNRTDLQTPEIGKEIERIGRKQPKRIQRKLVDKFSERMKPGGNVEDRSIRWMRENRLR